MLQPNATHLEEARFTLIKDRLLQFLDRQAIVQIQPITQVPGNYGELLQLALLTEWAEEQEKLKRCFRSASDEAELKRNFKILCAERDAINQASFLHYWSSPESLCNQLYWGIAKPLFSISSLGEMASLLIPSSSNALVIEFVIHPKNSNFQKEKLINRCQLLLKIKPIREISREHSAESPKALTRCVSGDGMVLNLEEIQKLPFQLHQQLYEALDAYPKLKNNLYTHNTAFQQLLFDIEWHNQKGMSVNTALTRFIEKLTISGTRYTATEYAGHKAALACVQFRSYLDQLPEEFRQTLLNLTANGFSLEGVLTYLDSLLNIRCVEDAASRLKAIQVTHFDFLDKHLSATKMQAREIEQRYHSHSLDLIGYQTSQILPIKLYKKLLKHVSLRSAADYIDCILNLPSETYEFFLESVQVLANPALPNKLADQLAVFSEEQNKAFLKAVIKNVDKFGGKKALLNFISQIGNNNLKILPALLALLPGQDRLTVINQKNIKGFTLLQNLLKSSNSDCLHAILMLLPEQDRLAAINEKCTEEFALLDFSDALKYLHTLLALLPQQDRLSAINQKGRILLHRLLEQSNFEGLEALLRLLSEEDRLTALNQKNSEGLTLLQQLTSQRNPEWIQDKFKCLPEQNYLAAINQKNSKWSPLLQQLIEEHNLGWLLTLFKLLSEQGRLISPDQKDPKWFTLSQQLIEKNNLGWLRDISKVFPEQSHSTPAHSKNSKEFTLLQELIDQNNSENLQVLLTLLPNYEHLVAISQKNERWLNLLYQLLERDNLYWLQQQFNCLPEKMNLVKHNKTNSKNFPLLQQLIEKNNLEWLKTLLMLLPGQDRLAAINEKDSEGRPFLHFLLSRNKVEYINSILALWPKQDRLAILNQTDAKGNSVLHWVIENGDPNICLNLLSLCPENDQATALNQKDRHGNTALYYVAQNNFLELFWALLATYSENGRLAALTQKNSGDNTILHQLAQNFHQSPNLLYKLLALFPEKDRLMVITQVNFFDENVLHLVAHYQSASFLKMIFELLPEYNKLNDDPSGLLSLPNITAFALFAHLYIANQILTIRLEEQGHRGYFKSTQKLRKKALTQGLAVIQKKIHEHIIANTKLPDFEQRCQSANFLSEQLKKINLLIDKNIIHSPSLQKHNVFWRAGLILLIIVSIIIFPVFLIYILFYKKKPTPIIKRAQACQSKITELQKLLDQYKNQSKPYCLIYTQETQNMVSDEGKDNFLRRSIGLS